MATIDSFCFSGELDLLELRLNILDPYVDTFVIAEAEVTFSGHARPLYLPQYAERFQPFMHKIVWWVTENYYHPAILNMMNRQLDLTDTNYPHLMAFYQKESLQMAFHEMGLKDDDIIYYGDADEIFTPQKPQNEPVKLEQLMYSMYLNNRTSEPWRGTFMANYATVKEKGINYLRKETTKTLPNGGWHMSNMGGLEEIRRKLRSYDHQEVNVKEIHDQLEQRYKAGADFLGRDYTNWISEEEWPPYLTKNRHKYAHLCR